MLGVHAAAGIADRNLAVQVRARAEDENLAEWVVDITSAAERDGSSRFVTGYAECVLLLSCCGQALLVPGHDVHVGSFYLSQWTWQDCASSAVCSSLLSG